MNALFLEVEPSIEIQKLVVVVVVKSTLMHCSSLRQEVKNRNSITVTVPPRQQVRPSSLQMTVTTLV